jgi:hydroxyethylthiazole kinase-like uncharacterized protein yjeF
MTRSVRSPHRSRFETLSRYVVSAAEMAAVEARIFAAGMPVEALMEKVAGRVSRWVQRVYPVDTYPQVGVLVGPGHNGGDALVVARELHFAGYGVRLYHPFPKSKPLTAAHAQYAARLGLGRIQDPGAIATLQPCDLIIDGLFGFGLTRALEGELAAAVNQVNKWNCPVVSIDLPSGVHTDTGQVLGTSVQATHTLCLGLWKQAFVQDAALDRIGQAELLDFDIPLADVQAILGQNPARLRITREMAIAPLRSPLDRATHKYKQGHLLLIAGSRQYRGAAVLSGLGARASGVGMLTLAVPESLREQASAALPEALVVGCPEQASGAIAQFPELVDLCRYDAIACGPGLTLEATPILQQVLASDRPVILDADGLNMLANLNPCTTLAARQAPTFLTPHPGEFKRLFPEIAEANPDRLQAAEQAAIASGAVVILKGAATAIAHKVGDASSQLWVNPDSTPALGRGGSGDALTGLLGGLVAQFARQQGDLASIAPTAVWWHAQAGRMAAAERTERGVDALTLTTYLVPALTQAISASSSRGDRSNSERAGVSR